MTKLFGAAIALAAVVAAVVIWWWGDSSYEECMLTRMKGQSQSMYLTVDKVCGRKFKKESRVYIGL